MTWVRLDDSFPECRKLLALEPLEYSFVLCLQVRSLCWSSRQLTDGFIPENTVAHLALGLYGADPNGGNGARMVEAKMWDRVEGGYQIHDYLEYNPSREEVLRKRKHWREKKERWKKSRGESRGEAPGESRTPPPDPHSPSPESVKKPSKGGSKEPKPPCHVCIAILDHFNKVAGKSFRGSREAMGKIHARHSESGAAACITVIEKMTQEWKGTQWEKWLSPYTLFRPSKFDAYLNRSVGPSKRSRDAVDEWLDDPEA